MPRPPSLFGQLRNWLIGGPPKPPVISRHSNPRTRRPLTQQEVEEQRREDEAMLPEVRQPEDEDEVAAGGMYPGKPGPDITLGQLGAAPGDRNKPDYSDENKQKWQPLSPGAVTDFVYNGEVLYFHSTNVAWASYRVDTRELLVGYKKGRVYEYSNVNENEALMLAYAFSKGGFVWDHLRVRGTRFGFRKPYRSVP